MKIEDFKNKKVTIFGLGVLGGGVGAAEFFARAGAKVTVTDIKKEEELKESVKKLKKYKINFVLGKHRKEDFINTDIVIKGPGIPNNSPYLQIAKANKVKIDTDVGIFFEFCKNPIIGVTGSKGKSTTAAILYEVLKKKYKNTLLGGNIGVSVLSLIPKIKKDSILVLELSSWQLEGLLPHKKSPHIAIITNIFPEHLNRYKNFEDYIEAKKIIFKFQKKDDYLILNENLKEYLSSAKSKIIYYDGNPNKVAEIVGAIYKVKPKDIQKAIKDFKGLQGRLEFLREVDGVMFFNDTCATHPEATIYSLEKLKKEYVDSDIILIAGGQDKNLDFSRFNEIVPQKVKQLILLPGDIEEKIKVKFIKVNGMKEAVKKAKEIATKGDIVLLSPAAASFNLFKNEFDRGEKFKEAVNEI